MRKTVDIVGINIDNITMDEGVDLLKYFLEGDRLRMVFTPNSEILLDAVRDRELESILNEGDLVIPDGIGVVIASKFYKTPLKERVAGIDLMGQLLQVAHEQDKSVYLFGAQEGVAQEAAFKLLEKYPGLRIAGCRSGYFYKDEEEAIFEEINSKNPDILLIGLGAPKQEKLIYKYRNKLNAKIAMGVGGSFDVLAGRIQRAPEFYQKAGLEWFYRFMKQPSRIGRMMKLPKFIALAFYDAKTR